MTLSAPWVITTTGPTITSTVPYPLTETDSPYMDALRAMRGAVYVGRHRA